VSQLLPCALLSLPSPLPQGIPHPRVSACCPCPSTHPPHVCVCACVGRLLCHKAEERWLAHTDLELLEETTLSSTYRWFWGNEDPMRAPLAKDKDGKVKAPPLGAAPEAPPLFGSVMRLVGANESEGAGALTSFMTAVQMREKVAAERSNVAAAASPAALAEEEQELVLARRLLKVLEDNKGKFPPGFDLAKFTAKVVDAEGASNVADGKDAALAPATKAAVAGVVCGVWVCGVWCVVCGVWCVVWVVCGVWCVVCGVWCVVCGVWCVVCGVWCVGLVFVCGGCVRMAGCAAVDCAHVSFARSRVVSFPVGVFSFLRKAARETPTLCVEPLGVLNTLVGTFEPQSMLGEPADSIASMHGFFSSLCTQDMAAAAALSSDLPEAQLVPASLSGLTALSVARGTLASVLNAVLALLAHTGPDAAHETLLPVPKPLLTLAKVAKGASSAVTVLPGSDTLQGTVPLDFAAGR
jgi:hypothetical protein